MKQAALEKRFAAAGFTITTINPIHAARGQFHLRSKAKMAVGGTVSQPLFGYPGADHIIREIGQCPLYPHEISRAIEIIRNGITREGLEPFQIGADKGEVKHAILWYSERTTQGFARLVLRSRKQLGAAQRVLMALQEALPVFRVLSINFQPLRTAIIEGAEEEILSPDLVAYERYGSLQFPISPQSFTQVTPEVAEALYQRAQSLIAEYKPKKVLDLFCGVGAFSLFAASGAAEVHGVEISSQAVQNAQTAATLNAVSNCSFECADIEPYLSRAERDADLIIVNPPRRGLGRAIAQQINRLSPKRVLYSSCNADTLLRDLADMGSHFRPVQAFPFDMFPNTPHLEVLVELIRL